jgi:hypothetical protein
MGVRLGTAWQLPPPRIIQWPITYTQSFRHWQDLGCSFDPRLPSQNACEWEQSDSSYSCPPAANDASPCRTDDDGRAPHARDPGPAPSGSEACVLPRFEYSCERRYLPLRTRVPRQGVVPRRPSRPRQKTFASLPSRATRLCTHKRGFRGGATDCSMIALSIAVRSSLRVFAGKPYE